MSKEKQKWSYECFTNAIADTGDYDSSVQFTNGKDTLQSCGDEIEEDECKVFCELLNKMPDLWSHRTDNAEFENSQLKKKVLHLENALDKIATGTQPYNEMEAFSFVDTARGIANDALKMNDVFL